MPQRLLDNVAVITGGGSGIGRACALRFAEEGAAIIVADFDAGGGEETVRRVAARGGKAVFVPVDTTQEAQVEAMVARGVEIFGRIDLCVAAAGIARGGPGGWVEPSQRLVVDKPTAYWKRVIDVDLTGVMLTNRAVARRLIEQGHGGKIVNISSDAGSRPGKGTADYNVAKAAVWMLTKVAALELGPHRIRVNCIAPGLIDTPLARAMYPEEGMFEENPRSRWLGRAGRPEDIANAAVFLCSDESDYITGQHLHVNGGSFTGE